MRKLKERLNNGFEMTKLSLAKRILDINILTNRNNGEHFLFQYCYFILIKRVQEGIGKRYD